MKKYVTRELFTLTERRYNIAKIILQDEVGKVFNDYIDEKLTESENAVLAGTLRDVEQEGFVNGVRSLIKMSKKERLDELIGSYKAFSLLKTDLLNWISTYEELNRAVFNEEVLIKD